MRKSTMQAVLYDSIDSLHRWGFSRIFLFDGHGDPEHNTAILETVQQLRKDRESETYYVLSTMRAQRLHLSGRESYLIQFVSPPLPGEPLAYIDVHAGTWETSAMLAYFPELVKPEIAKILEPTDLDFKTLFAWLQDAREVTPLGYAGNPANFRTQDVRQQWEITILRLADAIETALTE